MKALVIDREGEVTPLCTRVLKRCGAIDVFRIRTLPAATRQFASLDGVHIVIVNVDADDLRDSWPSQFINRFRVAGVFAPAMLYLSDASSRSDISALEKAGCYNILLKPLNESILEERTRALMVQHLDPQEEFAIVASITEKLDNNMFSAADLELDQAIRRHPASLKLHLLRGEALMRRQDLMGAKRSIALIRALDPDYGPAQSLLGRIEDALNEQRLAAEAEAALERSLIEAEEGILADTPLDSSDAAAELDSLMAAEQKKSEGDEQQETGLMDLFKQDFAAEPTNESPGQREERLRRLENEQRVLDFVMFKRKKP